MLIELSMISWKDKPSGKDKLTKLWEDVLVMLILSIIELKLLSIFKRVD